MCRITVMVFMVLVLWAAVMAVRPGWAQTPPIATATGPDTRWIDAWATSFLPTTVNGKLQPAQAFNNQTLRLIVFSKLGGTQARVKITNQFTAEPLVIGAAHIAVRASGGAIDPGPRNGACPGS